MPGSLCSNNIECHQSDWNSTRGANRYKACIIIQVAKSHLDVITVIRRPDSGKNPGDLSRKAIAIERFE